MLARAPALDPTTAAVRGEGGGPWLDRLAAIALVAAVVATYARALGNPFLTLWDDDLYVTANAAVRHPGLTAVGKVFTTFYVGNYAPVQMLSYMLDSAIWGMRPFGFILTNVAFHVVNAVLLFYLLRRLGLARAASACGALLFAVHPVQVEAVAWISQRKTLLAMLFFLAAIHLYLRARAAQGRARALTYLLANVAFLLAVLAKSVAVVLPVLLLLHDVLVRRERLRDRLADKVPFALAAAAAAGLALVSQQPGQGGIGAYHGGSGWHTFLTMIPVFRAYVGKVVWPSGLAALYAPPIKTSIDVDVLLSALLLLLVLAAPLLATTRRREAAFWTGTFFLGLLPVSQIVPLITLMNDRYLYFAMLGVAGATAVAVDGAPVRWRRGVIALLLVACAALGVAASSRTRVWSSSVALWRDAAEKNPRLAQAWYGLGNAHQNADDPVPAATAYRRALELDPGHRDVLYNLALVEIAFGDYAGAARTNDRLLHLAPGAKDAVLLSGHIRYLQRDYPGAVQRYRAALLQSDDSPEVLNHLALAVERAGDRAEAEALFARALGAGGGRAQLLYDRAALESLARDEGAALAALEAAFAAGFADVERLETDSDFAWLRGRPGYGAAISKFGAPERLPKRAER